LLIIDGLFSSPENEAAEKATRLFIAKRFFLLCFKPRVLTGDGW